MDNDPWKCVDQEVTPSSTLKPHGESFEDDFNSFAPSLVSTNVSSTTKNIKPFEPLPDSSTYLANLERKLSKITSKLTVHSSAEKRDFLASLSSAREGHIERLLVSNLSEQVALDDDIEEPVQETLTGTVVRHIAPHLQPVSAVELVHLLKADHLEQAYSAEETETKDIVADQENKKE